MLVGRSGLLQATSTCLKDDRGLSLGIFAFTRIRAISLDFHQTIISVHALARRREPDFHQAGNRCWHMLLHLGSLFFPVQKREANVCQCRFKDSPESARRAGRPIWPEHDRKAASYVFSFVCSRNRDRACTVHQFNYSVMAMATRLHRGARSATERAAREG